MKLPLRWQVADGRPAAPRAFLTSGPGPGPLWERRESQSAATVSQGEPQAGEADAEGMGADIRSLEWDDGEPGARQGYLAVSVDLLSTYKALVARLASGTRMGGPNGSYHVQATDPMQPEPGSFPAQVHFAIKEIGPAYELQEIMWLGNNTLQTQAVVFVVSLDPPSMEEEGRLEALAVNDDDWRHLRTVIYHSEGSALRDNSGHSWRVLAEADNFQEQEGWPRVVTFKLRYVPTEYFDSAGRSLGFR